MTTQPSFAAFADEDLKRRTLAGSSGLLPRQEIVTLIERKVLRAANAIEPAQLQPASLDLRLGARAHRVRSSFLPGRGKTVAEQLKDLKLYELSLKDGAILERGCVYLVELQEHLRLPRNHFASANPKSSTGRIDVFTRLVTDHSDAFDTVGPDYDGPLYAEVSPRTFSIRVSQGSRLNQIRFRRRTGSQLTYGEFFLDDGELAERHARDPLIDGGDPVIRKGLSLSVDLSRENAEDGVVGYRAKRYGGVIDVDNVQGYAREDFWEPIRLGAGRQLVLDPNEFYILASAERLRIPPDLAAEMVAIDPTMGEFRVHYAGFFDPGFGYVPGGPGSRGVLEVRSLEVPFLLEHGQPIGRLVFERLTGKPDAIYGEIGTSNYQGQGLKLSKHFR